MQVIQREELQPTEFSHELVGAEHGLDITIVVVEAPPGSGPTLHRHPYTEVFIVQEGEATFTVDGDQRKARAGDILVAGANEPHAFVNSGTETLRQIDIHLSPSFSTEWLEVER
jgi:quercetin dioxygenase-like cupin family protein